MGRGEIPTDDDVFGDEGGFGEDADGEVAVRGDQAGRRGRGRVRVGDERGREEVDHLQALSVFGRG